MIYNIIHSKLTITEKACKRGYNFHFLKRFEFNSEYVSFPFELVTLANSFKLLLWINNHRSFELLCIHRREAG